MKNLIVILLLLWHAQINAQILEVTTNENPAIVGEQIILQYSVNSKADNFKAPNIEGLNLLMGPIPSIQASYTNINGKENFDTTTTYSFYLQAIKEGDFIIAPAEITVNRKKIRSASYKLKIVRRKQNQNQDNQSKNNLTDKN